MSTRFVPFAFSEDAFPIRLDLVVSPIWGVDADSIARQNCSRSCNASLKTGRAAQVHE